MHIKRIRRQVLQAKNPLTGPALMFNALPTELRGTKLSVYPSVI